jgi:site-specific DNA recombinase
VVKRAPNEDDRRAVAYIRVSTQEQAQPDKPSLGQQEERIRSQCAASEWELVGMYRDVISGKEWERPSLQQLLTDAATGAFGRVVVLAIDRLGRNLRDLLEISERLRSLGVDLVSVKESFDTRTAVGRLYFQFLGMFAEFERERTKERTASYRFRSQIE